MNEFDTDFNDVTAVVVTFNSAHCISDLCTLLQQMPHVVIVDNASEDATCDAVLHQLPQARLLRNSVNLGFGAANNRGFAVSTTPYVLILNPDCLLPAHDLKELLQYAHHHPDATAVAPQLTQANGALQVDYQWLRHLWKPLGPAAEGPCCVGFLCGAAVVLRRDAIERVQGFDERFFLYYEDEDLFRRFLAELSNLVLLPSAKAMHASRGSVRGPRPWHSEYLRGFHHARSKLMYCEKWQDKSQARKLLWRVAALGLLSLPFRLLWPMPKYLARWWGRMHAMYVSVFSSSST
jgi:N-acetylglucosaminyl-diphospho-decaprenol L-rhamnosyltransferase